MATRNISIPETSPDMGTGETEEILPVVDSYDNVKGIAPRDEVHSGEDPLRHRSVTAIVYNPEGEVLVQERSDENERKPGHYEFPGGHVEAGESYLETVAREVAEELFSAEMYSSPLQQDDYNRQRKFEKISEDNEEFVSLYTVEYDPARHGELEISGEVEDADFVDVEEVLEMNEDKLTNSTEEAIGEYLEPQYKTADQVESPLPDYT